MTPTQIAHIEASFHQIEPMLEQAADTFYERLFELEPSLRALFRTPREQQARMLAQTLAVVVKGIRDIDRLKPAVQALGRRHVGYGVHDQHYATVGNALLWTLGQALGPAFTSEVSGAWAAAYGWIAFTMREAAAEVAVA